MLPISSLPISIPFLNKSFNPIVGFSIFILPRLFTIFNDKLIHPPRAAINVPETYKLIILIPSSILNNDIKYIVRSPSNLAKYHTNNISPVAITIPLPVPIIPDKAILFNPILIKNISAVMTIAVIKENNIALYPFETLSPYIK